MSTFSPTVMNWGGGTIIQAHLGPTNTGKTHHAIEKMLQYPTGMIGLPLRLLAKEVYDKIASRVGTNKVALLTGEQRIIPSDTAYWVCTVESMPVDKSVHFVVVDEVQLAAHEKRGHIFTDRLLNLRGTRETWFLGSDTMVPMIQRITPTAEMHRLERLSSLSWVSPKRLGAIPNRSAVIAFSARDVYRLAEQLRLRKGGAAVVLGALSPKARNAQVELFESGKVNHLVATDAIGMGLNLNIRSVFFSTLRKYDGKSFRNLASWELGQIAGRAGRFNQEGFFGVLTDCENTLSSETVRAIEQQSFPTVPRLNYRNSNLSFESIEGLVASLNRRPPMGGLNMANEQIDELALEALLSDPDISSAVASSKRRLQLLWEICQIPDYRQDSPSNHHQFLAIIARQLLLRESHLNTHWLKGRLHKLDRLDGSLSVMLRRISDIRSWAYIVHRTDWVSSDESWVESCAEIEDRLSDALHQRLTSEFVSSPGSVPAALIEATGLRMEGLEFHSDQGYLGCVQAYSFQSDPNAVRLFGLKRLHKLSMGYLRPYAHEMAMYALSKGASSFQIGQENITLSNQAVAYVEKGRSLLHPKLKPMPMDLLETNQKRALFHSAEQWLIKTIERALKPLSFDVSPAAIKGILFHLHKSLGVCTKKELSQDLKRLQPNDKKRLAALGIRIGYHHVYTLSLLKPNVQPMKHLLLNAWLNEKSQGEELPLNRVLHRVDWSETYAIRMGYPKVGSFCIRVDMLERVSAMLRQIIRSSKPKTPTEPMQWLGCSRSEWDAILLAMGYLNVNGVLRLNKRKKSTKKGS